MPMLDEERARWRRIKELVADAVGRPPGERARFLDRVAAGDEPLRREVDALLAAHDEAGDVFEQGPAAASAFTGAGAALPPAAEHLAPGSRLGPYEIVDSVGAGGMGEVYRARDTRLGRDVALKVLPPALVADPGRRARFVQEARAASALEHPHIAVIHEIGEIEGLTFIVMELVRGEPLSALVARGPVAGPRAIELALDVAEALARAHEIGIVHRDVKPANIMVAADGHVKVIDFGLAKLAGSRDDSPTATMAAAEGLTASGMVVGTAAYMSPEQAQGDAVDHRSDIFSFGIVLQELVTGSSPFRRRSSVDTMHAVLHDTPPRLPDSLGDGAAHLQPIIDRCLAKAPGDRYQAMRDLVGDLRAARRRLESAELRAVEGPSRLDRRLRIAAAVVVAVTLAIAAAVWGWARHARSEADRRATVAQVQQLVDRGRFVDVWRLARPALERWPGDPQLERMLRSTSQVVTLATEPSGADLAFKAYDDIGGEWLPIGTSPLNGVTVPLGMLRWRITKDGFDPLEARLEVGTPAAAAGRPDIEARPIRLRPVGSGVGRMVFVPGGVFDGVQLTDFWIDQYEVTNREFRSFVGRGGYDERFRDRTGRPGPATWQLGTYPPGQDTFPVTGVSWFEADAYCRAMSKSLPTLHHWHRAFGANFFSEVITAGNFSGHGPERVERLNDVGPFGTYGQAGNVKEWVWNEGDGGRYIVGGAWNEPVYMAVQDDLRPALARDETAGFRCIRTSAPPPEAAYAPRRAAPPRSITTEAVDDATFEIFRRFYSYERTPLDARIERVQESDSWRRERVSFAAAYSDERVLATILIPKNVTPPYQAVVWFPGSYALQLDHSDGDLPFSYYFDFLPRTGRALIYPVYKGTYERGTRIQGVNQLRDQVRHWSQDLGRTVDYLESRGDFDAEKIAYFGFSMGACCGAITALSQEPRFKAAVLLTGGIETEGLSTPPETDVRNFLPRLRLPVLLLGGEHDFSFPVETSQKPFFALLGTPPEHKRHVVFENAGHVPPRMDVIREVLGWLDRYLGPTESRRR